MIAKRINVGGAGRRFCLLATIGQTRRLHQKCRPDLRTDLFQGGEHPVEFRQTTHLLWAISDDKVFPLIMDSQEMGLRLDLEAEPLVSRQNRSLSYIMSKSAYLPVLDAMRDKKRVQVHLDSMNRAKTRWSGRRGAFAAAKRQQRMGCREVFVSRRLHPDQRVS